MDKNIMIGGPQGGGVETAGILAVRAVAIDGYEVFADREYHSNIKGKHSYSHIRFAEKRIGSIKYPLDALGALDVESLATHFHEVKIGGSIVHDSAISKKSLLKIPSMEREKSERMKKVLDENGAGETVQELDSWLISKGVKVRQVALSEVIGKALDGKYTLIEKVMNTALATVLLRMSGISAEAIKSAVDMTFIGKKDLQEINLKVVDAVGGEVAKFSENAISRNSKKRRLMVAGNDSVAIGKVIGGLRLQTYYPITPAADESFSLEQNSSIVGIDGSRIGSQTVVQAEDEIAAIAMAIGGGLAGVRSATSTSGPGFSLMAEALGWAGINETPVVVTLYQRGGPSTGLPTRNGQSDLNFAIYAGHGEFPRVVLASGDHVEATEDAVKCMNYAEEFQLPVIHLLDKGVANCLTAIEADFKYAIKRGKRFNPKSAEPYQRFRFAPGGISPRAYLGEALQWYAGDEHDVIGHISEDSINRIEMQEKRLGKVAKILSEAPDDDKARLFGPQNYDDLIITWGITKGACIDALDSLNKSGHNAAVLQVRMMEPFPSDYVMGYAKAAKRLVGIEANYSGILCNIVEGRCGIKVSARALKDTGRLISEDEVALAFRKIDEGHNRVVLSGGE